MRTRQWACGFCLSVTEADAETGPPSKCRHCDVAFCRKCGTALKGIAFVCHGCGIVFPETRAQMSDTSSFGCLYMHEEWMRRNKGRGATGDYAIATCLQPPDRGKRKLSKADKLPDGNPTHVDVRDLTPDEMAKYEVYLAARNGVDDYCI